MKKIIIAIVIILIVGLGIFYVTRHNTTADVFPETLGTYVLSVQEGNSNHECQTVDGKELCMNSQKLWYRSRNQLRLIQVIDVDSSSDLELFKNAVLFGGDQEPDKIQLSGHTLYKPEQHEVVWWTESNRIIVVQEYSVTPSSGGGESSRPLVANGENEVTKWFLAHFPPSQS